MLQEMSAEILFLDPTDVKPGVDELVARGFDVEILPWQDPYGPTTWVMARLATELSQYDFFEYVRRISETLNGDLVEAGLADPRPAGPI